MSKWYKLAAKLQMSYDQSLKVFGFPINYNPSLDEVKIKYRELSRKYHPDIGGDVSLFQNLNNANEVLKRGKEDRDNSSNPYRHYKDRPNPANPNSDSARWYAKRNNNEVPPWQTDQRSSYNKVHEEDGYRNLNFCLKDIYEHSLKKGNVSSYSIIAFDGNFFRGSFTANTNLASLGHAGEVMKKWNSEGANSYPTACVIASPKGNNKWQVINLKGVDVSSKNTIIESDGNPINDRKFSNKLIQYLKDQGFDVVG